MVPIRKHSRPVAQGVGILNLLTPFTSVRVPLSIFHILRAVYAIRSPRGRVFVAVAWQRREE